MWFTEFGQIAHEAAHIGGAGHLAAAEAALLSGDPVRLLEAFPGGVRIDDPRLGRVAGEASSASSAGRAVRGSLSARAERAVAVTIGDDRIVGEFDLTLTQDGRTFVLPIAVVVEPDPPARASGSGPTTASGRSSVATRSGRRSSRVTRRPANPTSSANTRPPSRPATRTGSPPRSSGTAASASRPARSSAGAARTTCTSSSRCSSARAAGSCSSTARSPRTGSGPSLEFNAVRWGAVDLPPQAGVAVYERGPSGKLHEARIYDDVEGPVE